MHNTVWQLISGYFQARSASVYQLFKPVDLGLQLTDLAGSSVGLIAINKQDSDTYHRVGGLNFTFNSGNVFTLHNLWARTFDQEFQNKNQDRNNAWYLGRRWRKENYRLVGSYIDIGQQFNPDFGYVRRQGVRQIRLETC